jgi:uncharacterized membrane protein YsdA (DUF1294 family)
MHLEQLALTSLVLINVCALLLMGYDKGLSMSGRGARRVPEKTFFIFALTFGAVGIYFGMLLFRHKTRKWYFQLGIPLLILLNLSTLYLLVEILPSYL